MSLASLLRDNAVALGAGMLHPLSLQVVMYVTVTMRWSVHPERSKVNGFRRCLVACGGNVLQIQMQAFAGEPR